MRLRFGDVTFDSGTRSVFRGPEMVHLAPKANQLQELLLSRRPDAVSKTGIQDAVWPDVVVTEGSLAVLVNAIRGAIGQSPDGTEWIRTIHGFGYAFDGPVREVPEGAPAPHRHLLFWGTQEMTLAEGANFLGREASADVWVGHPSISREHACIHVAGERADIEDLGSKNGTWVGGRRVEGRNVLSDGDEIRVGEVRLLYRGPASARSASTLTAR